MRYGIFVWMVEKIKMKKWIRIFCIAICTVFLFYLVVFRPLYHTPSPPPLAKTYQTLKGIENFVRHFDSVGNTNIKRILAGAEMESIEINRQIAAELIQDETQKNPEEIKGLDVSKGLFYDGWKMPILFMQTNNAAYYKLHPSLRHGNPSVIAWSSGKNKINEFGYDDDSFPGEHLPIKQGGHKLRILLRKTYLDTLYVLIDYPDRSNIQDVNDLKTLLKNKGKLQELEADGEGVVYFNPNLDLWLSAMNDDENQQELKNTVSDYAIILEIENQYLGVRFNNKSKSRIKDVPKWAKKWEIENGLKNDE